MRRVSHYENISALSRARCVYEPPLYYNNNNGTHAKQNTYMTIDCRVADDMRPNRLANAPLEYNYFVSSKHELCEICLICQHGVCAF